MHRHGLLDYLFTDLWLAPDSLLATLNQHLRGRFNIDLAHACVRAPTKQALAFEARSRLCGLSGWELMIKRNQWYQRHAVAELAHGTRAKDGQKPTVFAYSYAARGILEFAREQGRPSVLEQIDPGPLEERVVATLYDENPDYRGDWQPAPPVYWDEWRKECALADRIVVNSQWSYHGLLQSGVPAEKIRILPLAFEASAESISFERRYPAAFTGERPLRVLFLGQINLRKGIVHVLEAARLLCDEPIEFWLAGPVQIPVPEDLKRSANIRWAGVVPRHNTEVYYRDADVFLFPTYSDGFGLTQLEAQAWKLPLIASRFCGDVVCDGVNGVLMQEVSGEAIAKVVLEFVRDPTTLSNMAVHSGVEDRFSLKTLAQSLLAL
jgi:glycosyltransferase involved in cell wall biosynthesis